MIYDEDAVPSFDDEGINQRFEFELAQAEQFTANLLDQVRGNYEHASVDVPRDVRVAYLANDLFEQLPPRNLAMLSALLLFQRVEADQS